MKLIIIIEYIVNLILLLFFHMHMFQLNSYFVSKHMHWMKINIKKIIIQILLILLPTLLLVFNNTFFNLLAILFLGLSIFYNIPRKKAKIPFKITNRIKRMFITESLLILLIILINNNENLIYAKLCTLNILTPILYIFSNFINSPIEYIGKKYYINQAKKILKNMPNLIVIGVTGSYGKTSVKNFLVKTLSTKYNVLTTPKNYNTTLGVVKTLRENLKPIHEIFICEMGATRKGDIKEICDIVTPNIGIITAIGPQHLESFKNINTIIETKFELVNSVKENNGIVFLNYDNEYLSQQPLESNVFSYGINNSTLNYNAYDLNSSPNGLSFKILDKNTDKEVEFRSKLIGKHNVVNIAGAISIANLLGIPLEKLVPCVREICNVEHRLKLLSRSNLTIIDDSYNSNPISSKSALDTLSEFEGCKIIVTPGLIELGNDEKKYNFEFGQYMSSICDYIFLVGSEHSKTVLNGIYSTNFDKQKIYIVNSPEVAIQQIQKLGITDEITVLLENDLPDNYNL